MSLVADELRACAQADPEFMVWWRDFDPHDAESGEAFLTAYRAFRAGRRCGEARADAGLPHS